MVKYKVVGVRASRKIRGSKNMHLREQGQVVTRYSEFGGWYRTRISPNCFKTVIRK